MPVYEYRCTVCNERFARSESIAEHETQRPPSCPKCQAGAVESLLSPFFAKTVRKS